MKPRSLEEDLQVKAPKSYFIVNGDWKFDLVESWRVDEMNYGSSLYL